MNYLTIKWDSLIDQLVKNLPAMQKTLVRFLGQEDPLEKGQATHSSILGFRCGSVGKESTCSVGGLGLISALERSPGEGEGYPLQYSGLENSMNCIVRGVAKSQTQLSDFHSQQQNVLIFKNKILTTRSFLFVLVQESQFQVSRALTQ